MAAHISIQHVSQDSEISAFIEKVLPAGSFKKILIKPNWVKHAENPAFPIDALITSSNVIEAAIDACLKKYPDAERIFIGDVPLQSCEWKKLYDQAGIAALEVKYAKVSKPQIRFLDLRRERFHLQNGFLVEDPTPPGDPAGYVEAIIDEYSLLEEVVGDAYRFRVSDYDPGESLTSHSKNNHRYLVPKSILESDLILNMPTMKSHQKTGLTGALKNLIGINGQKSRLCTHRLGFPAQGGDEFPPDGKKIFYWQTRFRAAFQKRSPFLFAFFKKIWEVIKYFRKIKTVGTPDNLQSPNFYIGSGAWYGNDSIWRIVYDLHMALLFAPPQGGALEKTPQRRVFHILDAIIAGEGNGPLQPLPVKIGMMMASDNPFLVDFSMSKLMGFDWKKIRILNQFQRFPWSPLIDFTPESFEVEFDGKISKTGVESLSIAKRFLSAPGWRGHIELA